MYLWMPQVVLQGSKSGSGKGQDADLPHEKQLRADSVYPGGERMGQENSLRLLKGLLCERGVKSGGGGEK